MPNAMVGGDGGRLCPTLWWGETEGDCAQRYGGRRRRETVPNAMVGETEGDCAQRYGGEDGGRLCPTLSWGGGGDGGETVPNAIVGGERGETVPNAMVGEDGGRLCPAL